MRPLKPPSPSHARHAQPANDRADLSHVGDVEDTIKLVVPRETLPRAPQRPVLRVVAGPDMLKFAQLEP